MVKVDNTYPYNEILIGKNKEENDKLVKESNDTDYWFHLEAYPSCHIILKTTLEHPINNEMIGYCARLVKQNTKYKNIPKLVVMYCEIKNVTSTQQVGQVTVKDYKKIIV